MQEDLVRRLRVVKSTMRGRNWDAELRRQRSQSVTGGGRQEHGRHIQRVVRLVELEQTLASQERQVETDVVSNQRMVADELGQIAEHLGHTRGAFDHLVVNAGQFGNEGRDGAARVDQRGPLILDPRPAEAHRADLDDGVALGIQPRRLEIEGDQRSHVRGIIASDHGRRAILAANCPQRVRMIQDLARRLRANIQTVMVGKDEVIDEALAAVLCEGHVLLEDVPGIGKTTLARALAASLGCSFQRIQFTPDLLPSDITGISWFNQQTQTFEYRPGPLMGQIVLADEINRATPRTQSALLEAMQERQVTVDGVTRPLPRPFLVLATQNPVELEGTFPLPEAQLDRFLMRVRIGYPTAREEGEILERFGAADPLLSLRAVSTPEEIVRAQEERRGIRVERSIRDYMIAITTATRVHAEIALGASPRASLSIYQASQAWAAIAGRDFVLPDDIKRMAPVVLTHRLMIAPQAQLRGQQLEELLGGIIERIPVPVEG
jgi:MoxR-like ATPase